uniref:Helicase C-terminal domain-containing protein n=1 Tax=Arion vulgaris TaxID=1028688 RepID=A0A0B7BCW9_9EUPU
MITTTTALPSSLTLSTTAAASTVQPSTSSAGMSLLKCPAMLLQQNQQKPVMRVSPFLMSSPDVSSSVQGTIVSPSVMPVSATTKLSDSSSVKTPRKPMKKSELFLESLYNKKMERRQHILALMSRLNQMRCDASPVCGSDTHQSVNFTCILDSSNSCSSAPNTSVINLESWRNNGYVNCLFAQNRQLNHSHPDIYWRESTHLQQFVHSPVEWLDELKDVLSRFVFVTPSVISPAVSLRVSHPNQSASLQLDWMESRLRPAIVEKSSMLHPVQSRTLVTFPDLRLIQYDCGKLQTLDLLLRQLKSGQHRVLIFTQMTKMLDVLEAFLNFHGHRYLRLDGTTKVEQRQYLMDRFNADPRIFCFILSTRSGGIGVNLTGADTVVFYDSDWNPTMDAQAQDRCHRIGQTRDVHIYRLVSEMTVEENILKKANQKRLLGDLAIEGGNFTTAFFKEQTINDLFAEPSGLESLVEAREREREEKEKAREEKEKARVEKENEEKERKEKEESKKEAAILSQFEQALCKAEDETDAEAATQLQAEQKAELAEFDENIPWDEREAEMRKDDDDISKVEIELAMLDKELTPIERYAVTVMEAQLEPETAEELKMAEEDIENSKKDWELARLKALKEEEERRAELEEDEMLYIYSRNESQVKRGRKPLKKNVIIEPKAKSVSGSDVDESSSGHAIGGRRASDRNSPQKLNGLAGGPVKKNATVHRVNKKSLIAKAAVIESKKKVKAATNTLKKKVQNGPPKKRGRKPKSETQAALLNLEVGQVVAPKGQVVTPKRKNKVPKTTTITESTEENSEKKIKVVKPKNPTHLQNGHSVALAKLNNKIATQAKNALLKQQAQQAAHITVTPFNISPSLQSNPQTPVTLVANYVVSPSARPPPKQTAPKSPADPNVPPPWSNPNLVIRTRKAAVHSPVIIAQARPHLQLQHSDQQSVLQRSLSRPPVYGTAPTISISSAANVAKLQGTPDRNIFQIFNPNTSNIATFGGMTFSPGVRQVGSLMSGSPVVNQLRGATLINSVSLVNTAGLSGARFITTGMPGQSPVVVSASHKAGIMNVGSNMSNITLVPTVINASGGQTLLSAGGATIVNAAGARAMLNTTRLTSPIALQSLSSLPYTVNLIKTNTGLTLPVRSQQILQTSLAQVARQPGYVLITPRMRAPSPATSSATVQAINNPISLVQTVSGQTLQTARLHLLAQVPAGATVIQQPQKNVNGITGHTPTKTDGT